MLSAKDFSDIGLAAAGCSAITFFPQVLHSWVHRSANGLSTFMLTVGAAACVLWLAYGVYFHNVPILWGNSINLFFTLVLMYFKYRFRQLGEPAVPPPAPLAK